MLKSYLNLKLTFDLEDHLKSPKSYHKDIFLALIVINHIFDYLTLRLTLTLKMTSNHQNCSRNGVFVKITQKRRTTLFGIYVC